MGHTTIFVKASPSIAAILNQRSSDQRISELIELEREFGIVLKRLHYDTMDPLLKRYFMIEINDHRIAQKVLNRLLQIKGIEGAYFKPLTRPP